MQMGAEAGVVESGIASAGVVARKRCSTCALEKPLTDYRRNMCAPDGYGHECKSCRSLRRGTVRELSQVPLLKDMLRCSMCQRAKLASEFGTYKSGRRKKTCDTCRFARRGRDKSRKKEPETISQVFCVYKVCPTCGKLRDLGGFSVDKAARTGRTIECKLCARARTRIWATDNPIQAATACRSSQYKRRYGFTIAAYEAMMDTQGGVCAICGVTPEALHVEHLSVDHDHGKKTVRGLLCPTCNFLIGHAMESVRILGAAILYLVNGGGAIRSVGFVWEPQMQRKYASEIAKFLDAQDDQCAICCVRSSAAPRGKLFVDHCRTSMIVRGLLCHNCNSMLGHAKDAVNILLAARTYLIRATPSNAVERSLVCAAEVVATASSPSASSKAALALQAIGITAS